MVDVDTVAVLLQAADGSNPDEDKRRRAAEVLAKLKERPGYASALMSLWQSDRDDQLRLKSVIMFKNDASMLWSAASVRKRNLDPEQSDFLMKEKTFCKDLLLNSFSNEKNILIIRMLSQCIAKLARVEMRGFRKGSDGGIGGGSSLGWTELFPTLVRMLVTAASGGRTTDEDDGKDSLSGSSESSKSADIATLMACLLIISDTLTELSSARMMHFQPYFEDLYHNLLPTLITFWNQSHRSLLTHFKALFECRTPEESMREIGELKRNLEMCGYLNNSVERVVTKSRSVSMDKDSILYPFMKTLCKVLSELWVQVWPRLNTLCNRSLSSSSSSCSALLNELSDLLARCVDNLQRIATEFHDSFTLSFRHLIKDYLSLCLKCITTDPSQMNLMREAVVFACLFMNDVLKSNSYSGKVTAGMIFGGARYTGRGSSSSSASASSASSDRKAQMSIDQQSAEECARLFEEFFTSEVVQKLTRCLIVYWIPVNREQLEMIDDDACDFYHECTVEKSSTNVRAAAKQLYTQLLRPQKFREMCGEMIVKLMMDTCKDELLESKSSLDSSLSSFDVISNMVRRESIYFCLGLTHFELHNALKQSGFDLSFFLESILFRDLKQSKSGLLKARIIWFISRMIDDITYQCDDPNQYGLYDIDRSLVEDNPIGNTQKKVITIIVDHLRREQQQPSSSILTDDTKDDHSSSKQQWLLVRLFTAKGLHRMTKQSCFHKQWFVESGTLARCLLGYVDLVSDCQKSGNLSVVSSLMKWLSEVIKSCAKIIRKQLFSKDDDSTFPMMMTMSGGGSMSDSDYYSTHQKTGSAMGMSLLAKEGSFQAIQTILTVVPRLWKECDGPSSAAANGGGVLLRRTLLDLMSEVVCLMRPKEVLNLYEYVLPIVYYSTCFEQSGNEHLMLCESGISLWTNLLKHSNGYSIESKMDTMMFSKVWMSLMQEFSEYFSDLIAVLKSYLLLGGSDFISKHGCEICNIFEQCLAEPTSGVFHSDDSFEQIVDVLVTLIQLYPDKSPMFLRSVIILCLKNFVKVMDSINNTHDKMSEKTSSVIGSEMEMMSDSSLMMMSDESGWKKGQSIKSEMSMMMDESGWIKMLESHVIFYSRLLIHNRSEFWTSLREGSKQESQDLIRLFVDGFVAGQSRMKTPWKQRCSVFGLCYLIWIICESQCMSSASELGSLLDACIPRVFEYVSQNEKGQLSVLMLDQNEVGGSEDDPLHNEEDRIVLLNSRDVTVNQFVLVILKDTLQKVSDSMKMPLDDLIGRIAKNSGMPLMDMFHSFRDEYTRYRSTI